MAPIQNCQKAGYEKMVKNNFDKMYSVYSGSDEVGDLFQNTKFPYRKYFAIMALFRDEGQEINVRKNGVIYTTFAG